MKDITFDEYVKQKVDDMVENEYILNLICKNNNMYELCVDSPLGFIKIDESGTIYYNGLDKNKNRYCVSEQDIRSNFNKEAYIELLLKDCTPFKLHKNILHCQYRKEVLNEDIIKDRELVRFVEAVVDTIIIEETSPWVFAVYVNFMIDNGIDNGLYINGYTDMIGNKYLFSMFDDNTGNIFPLKTSDIIDRFKRKRSEFINAILKGDGSFLLLLIKCKEDYERGIMNTRLLEEQG